MAEYLGKAKNHLTALNQLMHELESPSSKTKFEIIQSYQPVIESVTPIDLFYCDWYGETSTKSIEEIKTSAGRFVNLFFHALSQYHYPIERYPLLVDLNQEITHFQETLEILKKLLLSFEEQSRHDFDRVFKELEKIHHHFERNEMLLFAVLDRRSVRSKVTQVLWSVQDELKIRHRKILTLITTPSFATVSNRQLIAEYLMQLIGFFQKEQLILYPALAHFLNKADWQRLSHSIMDYPLLFDIPLLIPVASNQKVDSSNHPIVLKSGTLQLEELALIFDHLPLSLTYVDEHNTVRYFNQTKHRHFPRSIEVIGRSVELCHPASSVHYVLEILEKFRRKEASQAQFWLVHKERFLYIEYTALYDESGKYRGVLETSQDITDYRNLTGERKLAQWK